MRTYSANANYSGKRQKPSVRVYTVRAYRKDKVDPNDPDNWKTINGTPVMIDPMTGELLGDVGKKIAEETQCYGHPSKRQIIDSLQGFSDADKKEFVRVVNRWVTSNGCREMRKQPPDEDAELLDAAIDASSEKWSDGALYRGVSLWQSDVDNMKVGDVIDQKGISSWSTDDTVAESFSIGFSEDEVSVMYIEDSTAEKRALSVTNISGLSGEQEVIYHSKAQFEIVKIESAKTYDDEDLVKIHVKEVPCK